MLEPGPPVTLLRYCIPLFRENCYFPLVFQISPDCVKFKCFFYIVKGPVCFSFPPSFSMKHLCITQCTYWTPLAVDSAFNYSLYRLCPMGNYISSIKFSF